MPGTKISCVYNYYFLNTPQNKGGKRYSGTPLVRTPVGQNIFGGIVFTGWPYYWGGVKFHELRAIMTNTPYIAFAFLEQLFSLINNLNRNVEIAYSKRINHWKLSFSKTQNPFKNRLLNRHKSDKCLLSVL